MRPVMPDQAPTCTPYRKLFEIEARKNANHDAGQAVLGRLLDFKVAWVFADEEFTKNNSQSTSFSSTSDHSDCMPTSSLRQNSILTSRCALNKQDKQTVIDYCTHVFAGPFVEWLMSGESFTHDHSSKDYSNMRLVLLRVEPDIAARKKLFDRAQWQAVKLVQENLRAIAAVADALLRRGTLVDNEIDEIIKIHRSQPA